MTCKGTMAVYSGKVQREQQADITVSYHYDITPKTEILTVRCKNFNSKPWILASLSNGMYTDTRWKCFSFPREKNISSRTVGRPHFNDSHWAQAVAGFSNRGESPWGKALGIKDEARWISTGEDNPRLLCRRNLSDEAYLPTDMMEHPSRGTSFFAYLGERRQARSG